MLPSITTLFAHPVKEEPDLPECESTPSLIADVKEEISALSTSPTSTSLPTIAGGHTLSSDLYNQLSSFAASSPYSPCSPSSAPSTPSSSPPTSPDYDSDGTDSLLTRTPCPFRGKASTTPRTGLKSRFFSSARNSRKSQPVRRVLDFGRVSKVLAVKRAPQKSTTTSPLERQPSHQYVDFIHILFISQADPLSLAGHVKIASCFV